MSSGAYRLKDGPDGNCAADALESFGKALKGIPEALRVGAG